MSDRRDFIGELFRKSKTFIKHIINSLIFAYFFGATRLDLLLSIATNTSKEHNSNPKPLGICGYVRGDMVEMFQMKKHILEK